MTGMANPAWNPWCNDKLTFELYRRRCRKEEVEMTCAAQAAEIISHHVKPGETLLDAGCAGGYYYWSFKDRNIDIDYRGIDYTPEMIDLARNEMCPRSDLEPEDFEVRSIEDVDGEYDNVLCFNVLTNNPHYALPLERLLYCTKKRMILRECLDEELIVRFTPDTYLDEGKKHIRVYHNTYPIHEVTEFIESFGFRVCRIVDQRTQDGVETVCDIPHPWRILLAEKV